MRFLDNEIRDISNGFQTLLKDIILLQVIMEFQNREHAKQIEFFLKEIPLDEGLSNPLLMKHRPLQL